MKTLDERFAEYAASSQLRRARLLCAVGALLTPLYGPFDVILFPARSNTLLLLRGGLVAVAGLTWWLLPRARRPERMTRVFAGAMAVYFALIATSAQITNGDKFYHFGLMLTYLGVGVMASWSLGFSAFVYGSSVAVFAIPMVVRRPMALELIALDVAALSGFAALACIGIEQRYRASRLDFEHQERLATANSELQETSQFKDRVFQNISHEFRTPLAVILSALERIQATAPREQVETIRGSSLRLLNLINELLQLAKLETRETMVEAVPVQIDALLHRLERDVTDLAKRQRLSLQFDDRTHGTRYLLDARHLEKVLLNLLSNAVKFTPAGGSVTLTATSSGRGLSIAIADTGPGIAKAKQSKLFTRFGQLDGSTTRRYGGTGIGLALVKELTEAMGGAVTVESDEGKGATFALEFPPHLLTDRPAPASNTDESAMAAWSSEAARRAVEQSGAPRGVQHFGDRGPLVLVAEDDGALQREIVDVLQDGFRLAVVGDGEEALAMAASLRPNVIMTDFMMPRLDGVQVVTRLRSMPAFRDTPIVMMSARADVDSRVEARSVGVDTYLTKPFDRRELRATIEGLLRARMKLVGEFFILGRLGDGGQGEVFLGERLLDGALGAVKVLVGDTLLKSNVWSRFEREARVLMTVSHSNVLRVLETGTFEGRGYLVTEVVRGASVKRLLRVNRRLAPSVARDVCIAVASALDTVHASGIIHRDIKSDNVMLSDAGSDVRSRVKVIDFGAAHVQSEATLTPEGFVMGTLAYMAPELQRGSEASPRSDQFSLGALTFEMLTGALPSNGVKLRALEDEVPQPFIEVVERMMAPSPADRWSSLRELMRALERLELEPAALPYVPIDDLLRASAFTDGTQELRAQR